MTFVIHSGIARVVILASICIGMVKVSGVDVKSNISRGLFVIVTATAAIFDKMLLADESSIAARSVIQQNGGVPVQYSEWILAFLPAALLTVAAAWAIILWLYPPEKKKSDGRPFRH